MGGDIFVIIIVLALNLNSKTNKLELQMPKLNTSPCNQNLPNYKKSATAREGGSKLKKKFYEDNANNSSLNQQKEWRNCEVQTMKPCK